MSLEERLKSIERILKEVEHDKCKKTRTDNSLQKLSDVKEMILEHYRSNNSNNTYLSYRNSFNNLIRLIGDKCNNSINKTDFEEFKTKRSNEVNLVSTNIDIRNLKAIYNKMIEFDLISSSEALTVKQFKIEKKKMLAIDQADIVKILNFIENIQLNQIVRFTLLTASRISEVLNLKIKDIDFENEVINIFQQKSNSFKTIPLTKRLLDLIMEIIYTGTEKNILTSSIKNTYLFYNKDNNDRNLKLRADTVSKKFKKVLNKLDLSKDFKFHSLRHTAVTELIRNNVPLNVVKEIAGHNDITTTMQYSHVKSNDLKQAVNLLSY